MAAETVAPTTRHPVVCLMPLIKLSRRDKTCDLIANLDTDVLVSRSADPSRQERCSKVGLIYRATQVANLLQAA